MNCWVLQFLQVCLGSEQGKMQVLVSVQVIEVIQPANSIFVAVCHLKVLCLYSDGSNTIHKDPLFIITYSTLVKKKKNKTKQTVSKGWHRKKYHNLSICASAYCTCSHACAKYMYFILGCT